ncbi:hypothetical protein [Sphingobacterium sp. BN32]|uniref:DUF6999 family protein n=1 Tax=Sphingobacterium sp. BN32 TaxID=3058432 RepID=UPI00265C940E|nr:hypothetical protein [Sphingobacterium sp. BN32]WKK59886.1 hypothetical protein QYC40_06495 [Sphingobacterium sp. BN32]
MIHNSSYFERLEHNPRDPSHWHALFLDNSVPFNKDAKAAFLFDSTRKSKQFLLPFLRVFGRLTIIILQIFKAVAPNLINAPKTLHRFLYWGMKYWVSPEANFLILRHFYLGSEVLRFIKDNVEGAENIPMNPLKPLSIEAVKDNLFLEHDLNLYNFIINLNKAIQEQGLTIHPVEHPDFSAIGSQPIPFEEFRDGWTNILDLSSAIEIFTPVYQFFLTDNDFWRASNSLQLDEVIGVYAATIMRCPEKLVALNNKHPMIPLPTYGAGFRLVLHGLSTEVLHHLISQEKLQKDTEVIV